MVGGGGSGPSSNAGYRSVLDQSRSAANPARTPQAEYPDGYLGNIRTRREDRLLKDVQSRLTQRSYQRGVHKGERVDPTDYLWDKSIIDPEAGLRAEAKGLKWTAKGETPQNIINHMGKNHLLSPEEMANVANGLGVNQGPTTTVDPLRASKMSRLLPSYK